MVEEKVREAIRDIPDFPEKGIVFKDITPIMENPELSKEVIESLRLSLLDSKIDAIIGIESRGFLFGMPLALAMNVPFILMRKKGKLPYKTSSFKYDLEYGSAEIEVHKDSIKKGWNVLVHDDLLATGGTAAASAELVLREGGKVAGFSFLVNLTFLKGVKVLEKYSTNITSIVNY